MVSLTNLFTIILIFNFILQNYVTITSSMLEMSKMETWEDLTRMDQSDTASHLINSLEESAFLLADNLNSGSTVSREDNNVGKCETCIGCLFQL